MATIRDNEGYFTHEANEYSKDIGPCVKKMLNLAKDKGFNISDAFYLIMTEVNTQQLLDLLRYNSR